MDKEKMDSLIELDLYKLIGVSNTATNQEIKKAYRKKALSCHPDKNPDNPKAAELFHELSRALEILTDTSARAAYDKVVHAKYEAKLRIREFDAKRRKLKEDLEAREDAYKQSLSTEYAAKSDRDKLQAEIERLQKEGSKQLEEEIIHMKRKIEERSKQFSTEPGEHSSSYKIKIKWRSSNKNLNNGVYNYDTLHRMFSKYGDIAGLVVSSVKDGSALIEYQSESDAELALNTEVGLAENPLKLQKLWDTQQRCSNFRNVRSSYKTERNEQKFCTVHGSSQHEINRNAMSDVEFEMSVLNNLRRAEEKKRCLEKTELEEGT